mgnify:FL=1
MGDFRSENPYLKTRYGIKESTFPKWLPFAITFLIAGTIWTIWSGSNHAVPEVRYNLISFNPISAKEIGIRFTVNFKSKEKSHFCRLVARDIDANIAGEKIMEFPSGTIGEDVRTTIPTRVAAVNAGILGCEVR